MAVPHQALNKIRHKIRAILGNQVQLEDYFFTFDRDSNQIVTNRKIRGSNGKLYHFIFDADGNYKMHED